MTDRAKKISELTVTTSATGNNILVLVQNVSGSYTTKSITANNLLNSFIQIAPVSFTKPIKIANSAATYTANAVYDEVILANPNVISTNITVTLPVTAANGKVFIVKNLNPVGGYTVTVTTSQPAQNRIEDQDTHALSTQTSLTNVGQTVTWICDNGYYRILSHIAGAGY